MQQVIQQGYSFDGFTLDLARGCLLGGDQQEIKLRPKSFMTLKYLVENNGRLVGKDELIEAVWPGTAVTDNSLVQCLKEVREALGDKSQQYIKTVPRRGYIFTNLNGSVRSEPVGFVETVEGIRVVIDEQVQPRTSRTTWTSRKRLLALPLLALGLLAPAVYFLAPSKSPRPNKIAILPFRSLGDNEDEKYLGLGIADTLITRLGSTEEILVRPTSAIQKYTLSTQDSLVAGREQEVDAVLEGSVQKLGDEVRITVRLIKVADGSTLWAYKSSERSANLFAVEDLISEKLANELELKLTGEQKQRLARRYTDNTEAYKLYAKGVFLRNQMNEEALQKSIECFQKAIELDPNYALAYAGQASSISPLAYLKYIPIREAESRNRSLIAKALELDDTLPEAHAALAEFKLFIEWDWSGAEKEFKRALELNPHEQLSLLLYPDVLLLKGQPEEAVNISRSAFEIDPLSPRTAKGLAHVYYYAGKYDQALEQSKKTLELFPDYRMIFLGPIYEMKGMHDQSIEGYLQTEKNWGQSAANIEALRRAYAEAGWRGYWQKRLELLMIEAKVKPVPPLRFATLYARLGDKDKAFEWLEKTYNEHDMTLPLVKVDPVWETLHSDPRFTSLLHRMRLTS